MSACEFSLLAIGFCIGFAMPTLHEKVNRAYGVIHPVIEIDNVIYEVHKFDKISRNRNYLLANGLVGSVSGWYPNLRQARINNGVDIIGKDYTIESGTCHDGKDAHIVAELKRII